MPNTPTILDVYQAQQNLKGIIRPTPLLQHPLLSAETGLELYVKHENHNPTGAFKIRGGLNLVQSLGQEERRRGVITASTGNHGQSIAFACQRADVPCTVFVPIGNNPEKNSAMRAYGAKVVEYGRDFDEARERIEEISEQQGLRYIHSANEPKLIAGVGTYALEIFKELEEISTILVPIGGGSGASGLVTVRQGLKAKTHIIGVQSERADAFARSWRGPQRVIGAKADTFAEGIATRVTFDLTFDILKQELDDVITLSEKDLEEGVRLSLRTTHNLAEGAGAASLIAALKHRDQLRKGKVVAVMSGGNIDTVTLRKILREE